MATLHLMVVKKGDQDIPGLTDRELPRSVCNFRSRCHIFAYAVLQTQLQMLDRRLAPKRASKIRKLFNLTKDDDVRQYVIRREIPGKDDKKGYSKAAKIQRLITPQVRGSRPNGRGMNPACIADQGLPG